MLISVFREPNHFDLGFIFVASIQGVQLLLLFLFIQQHFVTLSTLCIYADDDDNQTVKTVAAVDAVCCWNFVQLFFFPVIYECNSFLRYHCQLNA